MSSTVTCITTKSFFLLWRLELQHAFVFVWTTLIMHENMLFFVEKVATLITFYRARLVEILAAAAWCWLKNVSVKN